MKNKIDKSYKRKKQISCNNYLLFSVHNFITLILKLIAPRVLSAGRNYYTKKTTINKATMFRTLIIGLIAGPAVSL